MRRAVCVLILGAALAGCASNEMAERDMIVAEIEARDNAACVRLGAMPGTDIYIMCRLELRNERAIQDAADRTAAAIQQQQR
jgi:hypothetical protein